MLQALYCTSRAVWLVTSCHGYSKVKYKHSIISAHHATPYLQTTKSILTHTYYVNTSIKLLYVQYIKNCNTWNWLYFCILAISHLIPYQRESTQLYYIFSYPSQHWLKVNAQLTKAEKILSKAFMLLAQKDGKHWQSFCSQWPLKETFAINNIGPRPYSLACQNFNNLCPCLLYTSRCV